MSQNPGTFTKEEVARYSRQLILPEFGREGQERVRSSSILVVGAGGLGCPLLQYLTAAGIGTIGVIDPDTVDISNLQRQVLYTQDDIGKSKAEVAVERLSRSNPNVQFRAYTRRLTSENALELIREYDIVADGSDNFPTRYLINDACVILNKPFVYGSVYRYEGQVSVFNYQSPEGRKGPQYRDLFPSPPPPQMVPNCSEGGVMGVLPGIIGCIQANEVLKVLSRKGEVLSGKIFLFDAHNFDSRTVTIPGPRNMKITHLIDYEDFCGIKPENMAKVKEVTVKELNNLIQNGESFKLIDVREPYETEIASIGGNLIPMRQVPDQVKEFESEEKVIVYCRSGRRSADVIRMLEKQFGYDNLYNLKGGILAWSDEIDPSVNKY